MNTPATPSAFERANDLWWVRFPAVAYRASRALSGILADGLYLSFVPKLGALAPPLVFLSGLLVGWWHLGFSTEQLFSASLVVMVLMVAISSFSAACGCWAWLGYVIGDFFLYRGLFTEYPSYLEQIIYTRVPLFIPYALLAMLMMFTPSMSRALSNNTLSHLRSITGNSIIVQSIFVGILQGLLVYAWTQAVPTLIRPVYTWQGSTPSTQVMQPLQETGWILAELAALFATVRTFVEYRMRQQPAVALRASSMQRALMSAAKTPKPPLPPWMYIALKTILTTFILAGALTTWFDALTFAAVMAAILFGREYFINRFDVLRKIVARVPLLLRLIAATVINYFLATQIITLMWSSTSTFRPIIISTTVSLIVFSLLVPDARLQLQNKIAKASQAGGTGRAL